MVHSTISIIIISAEDKDLQVDYTQFLQVQKLLWTAAAHTGVTGVVNDWQLPPVCLLDPEAADVTGCDPSWSWAWEESARAKFCPLLGSANPELLSS